MVSAMARRSVSRRVSTGLRTDMCLTRTVFHKNLTINIFTNKTSRKMTRNLIKSVELLILIKSEIIYYNKIKKIVHVNE